MTTIFSRQVICKKCGAHIPTYSLGSTNTGGNQHTDLYQKNCGTQAIHYMLPYSDRTNESICSKKRWVA